MTSTTGSHTGSKEIQLFNYYGDGGAEIQRAIGLISDRVDFDTWAPILPMGIRDVAAIIGREPIMALAEHYTDPIDNSLDLPLRYLQQAVAYFTWLKIIPTLDAQHDNNGRQRRLGENEKGLTALEQYKDEANIQRLAYEAVDALIEVLDAGQYDFWLSSAKYLLRRGLIVYSKEVFDQYYRIGSHRLFLTLLPIIREVQNGAVQPIVGKERINRMLAGEIDADTAARAIVILTMKKAVERLPVEVLPEGVVQLNQSAPIKQRIKAEREARQAVATSLGEDAKLALRQLEDEASAAMGDVPYVSKPLVHSKGMSF